MVRNFTEFLVIILLVNPFVAFAQNRVIESSSLLRGDESNINFYLERSSIKDVSEVLLLIIQSSDCNSVSHSTAVLDMFRNVWPSADLLTVEKYGIDSSLSYSSEFERDDCPDLYIQGDNPEQRVQDFIQILNHIRQKNNYKKIVLLGLGEGGVIASMLASRVDYIDAIISFKGGGRWYIDDVLYNMQNSSENQNEINKNMEEFKQFAEHILSSEPFNMSKSNHGYYWWRRRLEIDQQDIITKIKSPVLIVIEGGDSFVSASPTKRMENELRNSSKRNIGFILNAEPPSIPGVPYDDDFTEILINNMNRWLRHIIEKSPNN